jgi:hypothetical protein
MSPSPAENSVPGVVTFTARGNAALDQLADTLVAECDGSPTGIANLLEQVLKPASRTWRNPSARGPSRRRPRAST